MPSNGAINPIKQHVAHDETGDDNLLLRGVKDYYKGNYRHKAPKVVDDVSVKPANIWPSLAYGMNDGVTAFELGAFDPLAIGSDVDNRYHVIIMRCFLSHCCSNLFIYHKG
jgi:hypothetical protein